MACQKHPISQLQELCQSWKLPLPVYRECEGSYQEFGTEVTMVFDVATDDKIVCKGLGRTKKASKTNVAQMAITYIAENKPHLLEKPTVSEVSSTGDTCECHGMIFSLKLGSVTCLPFGRKVIRFSNWYADRLIAVCCR